MILTQNDIFAIYRLPHSDNRIIIIQNSKENILFNENSFNKKGFVFYPFSTENHPAIFINADEIHINKNFDLRIENINNSIDITKREYLKKIKFFVEEIKNGYRKIVLSRTKSLKKDSFDLFRLFIELDNSYSNAMIFLINHPLAGTWMGATPEILIEKNDYSLKTMALAGTQFVSDPDSVTWEHKELDEQKAVMEFIEDILSKNKIQFSSEGPVTKIAAKNTDGYLVHLATYYQTKQIKDFYNIIMELHPTPAVSGLPKEKAIKYILENEGYDRKYYTGFLGPVNIEESNTAELFVNLRSMEIFKNKFLLYLGGGLNKDSIPIKEWEETENKSKTLVQIIESLHKKIKFPMQET